MAFTVLTPLEIVVGMGRAHNLGWQKQTADLEACPSQVRFALYYCRLAAGRTASCAAADPLTGTAGTSGGALGVTMPSFWRSWVSILVKTSRLSLRKLRTFSRPWPMRSPA